MSAFQTERVLTVHHWTDQLFSFTTTRDTAFRFVNGQFTMIGLPVNGKPLLRAYSIASANYEDHLEFYSIKVPNGPLTSRLQHLQPGDQILVNRRPTGTLVTNNVLPGKRLFMLSTGTGLAPFLSIIRDPETYERFEHVVMVHGVRQISDLGYSEYIKNELPKHEFIGEQVKSQLHYYPTVTREPFEHQGRVTELLQSGKLCDDLGLPQLSPEHDRALVCGGPSMLADLVELLEGRGFREGSSHDPQHYTIERAFVEK
jgi:ferredoxin--NADP+ reductase